MPYPFQVTYRPDGTEITTTLWVDDRQEIANAISPEYCNDWSANVTQMRETADPGDVGSENLAIDLAGELKRLRFKIKQLAERLNGGPISQWYASFPGDLAVADGGTGASTPEGARANLGLGTMSTQDANSVRITGGTIDNVTMGGGGIAYAAKILAKQGNGGVNNPNNAGYAFDGDVDTGLFEAAAGGPIDLYIDGAKKYAFGGTFLDLITGQIRFPAVQLASANANTLDDYEEGTWVPAFGRSIVNPSVTYNSRSGSYIKVGRMVFIGFEIDVASVTSQGSGNWGLDGLPFATGLIGSAWSIGGGLIHFSTAFSEKCNLLAFSGGVPRTHAYIVSKSSGYYDSSSVLSGGIFYGFGVYVSES